MWSIIIVLPIIAWFCFFLTPTLFHFFWYLCHGIIGFDHPPGLFLYWGGGINRINSPEFTGPVSGTLGNQSDYQQVLTFLSVYNYIERLKREVATGSSSTLSVFDANGKLDPNATAAAASSSALPTVSAQSMAEKLKSRLKEKKIDIDVQKMVKGMRAEGRSDTEIARIMETVSDYYAKDSNINVFGIKGGMPVTKKNMVTEEDIINNLDSGLGLEGLGWQTLYNSANIDDPVAQMLLQLTEDAPVRVCRTLISRRSWNTAKLCNGIVVYYSLALTAMYFIVECFLDPRSIWFGGWY